MNLIKEIVKVKIGDLEPGTLFIYDKTVALKTEFRNGFGTAYECFIVGSGEQFWGGVANPNELNELMVTPLILEED